MAWQSMVDTEYSDDELLDRALGTEASPATHPTGLQITLPEDDLAKAGCEGGEPGDLCHLAVMGTVTARMASMDGCRIELEIGQIADEDGHFVDLDQPGHMCLTDRECELMDLDDDCEVGDLIHLVGEARLERTMKMGEMSLVTLQMVKLGYVGNESDESREG